MTDELERLSCLAQIAVVACNLCNQWAYCLEPIESDGINAQHERAAFLRRSARLGHPRLSRRRPGQGRRRRRAERGRSPLRRPSTSANSESPSDRFDRRP